ncbi:MAG TPA: hypothetical protein VGG28_24910 [Kofleriaceae bacterium]
MSRKLLAATASAAAAFAIAACQPSLPDTPPTAFVIAQFDPTTSAIPLPNDLVLEQSANSLCTPAAPDGSPACAQAELIQSFKDANGFPSDQEVSVTVDFIETSFDANGSATNTAPDLDLTTFTPNTYFVWGQLAGAAAGELAMEPIQATDYVKSTDHGELTLHHKGHLPWPTGSIAVLIRGGDNGVMTTDKLPVNASQVFSLLEQDVDLSNPKNNGLLKAELGSQEAANSEGLELDEVNALWNTLAYPAADMRWPHQELAILTQFSVQPTVTNVSIDPARGLVPLPIDLLRDPTSGNLSTLAACTLAGSSLAADGTCPSAAAAGFEALDGFSTTGAILGPTSELVDGTTIDGSDLQVWDLTDVNNPVQVDPTTLIQEPCEFTSGCNQPTELSPVIAIQPAGATAGDPTSVFRTKPLKDNTEYAVVMTTGIKDKAGNSIGPGTVAKVLHFANAVYVNGHSALQGIDDTTAHSLENMRQELAPLFSMLAANGTDFSKIGIAYTFKTQTILSQGNELAALPYLPSLALGADSTAVPTPNTTIIGAGSVFGKYGVDPSIPNGSIGAIMEFDIPTIDALDPLTGAFMTDPTKGTVENIHVLLALPDPTNTNIPACTGALLAAGVPRCAPLMVFRHGLGGGRADMLTVANQFTAAGMAVVAIDAAKHGDRSFCTPTTNFGQCKGDTASMTTCTTSLPSGAQGDVNPPGSCPNGFTYEPVSAFCGASLANAATCDYTGSDGIPAVSGNYLITSNFFRTRDTMRQDMIDESQLIRAVAFVPSAAAPTSNIFGAVEGYSTSGGTNLPGLYVIDPGTVFFSGQSLGAINGAADVATNPRIAKAGLNVGGGTVVDVFTNSPAFVSETDALLAGLGIQPGTSAYLQFLVVAKTVLDPADPINFVGHITHDTLPNLLGTGNQAPKAVLSQSAYCDQTVPNPFNFIYANVLDVTPLPPTGGAGSASAAYELFVNGAPNADLSCNPIPTSAVEHAFITDWKNSTITTNAQNDIANFVMKGLVPPSIQQ